MKKNFLTFVLVWFAACGMSVTAQCPAFSVSPYPSVSYNLNATPWEFELHVLGDTTGAHIQWYRYVRDTETEADAVPYNGQGSNTVDRCYPQTDDAMRNTWYNYYCVITTDACPAGVKSQTFDVQVATGSVCMTMDGTSFTFQSAPGSYNEGDLITLTAYYNGYGGFHYYTWFFNGDTLREDENHIIYNDPDNFNYSVLTIPASEVADAGSYSVAVMDGPECIKYTASSKTITVKPHEYLVFDDNNGTHLWSDPKNWWPNYNRIPTTGDSAVIRKPCGVDISDAKVGDLMIEMTSDTALVIRPQCGLVVARRLHCKEGDILIEADETGNGALVMGAGNTNIPATVQFYARSEQMNTAAPVWQYMGYPMQDSPLLKDAYAGAAMYAWTNVPNLQIGGNWQELDGSNDRLKAFTGYCMTEAGKKRYSFKGVIHNPQTRSIAVPYNDRGTYSGFALLANSWTAPVSIASLETADFGDADATVYIMNTGTYAEAVAQQSAMAAGEGPAKGQYNAIPVHAASYLPDALTVIPPMQGFFVHTGKATTLTLDYQKAVYTPALAGVNNTPLRAPALSPQDGLSALSVSGLVSISVSGFGAEDVLRILVGGQFSEGFENGWDGRKAYSRSPLSIAAQTSCGDLAVAALPELEGLPITVTGGLDKYYTLSVRCTDDRTLGGLCLLDKETGIYTPLTNGAEYTYTFTGNPHRFAIVRRPGASEEGGVKAVKVIRNGHLFIQRDGVWYDASGRKTE